MTANPQSLREALSEWKCPACGGSGIFRWQDTETTCRKCNGDGLHPTASAALSEPTREDGVNVERLARALHKVETRTALDRQWAKIDVCYDDAKAIAAEYARLSTPTTQEPTP